MCSVAHLKVVMATYAYFMTHTLLMIITNVNLMTHYKAGSGVLLKGTKRILGKYETRFRFTK